MLFTSLGLVLKNITSLHLLPIGRWIKHCVSNWKIIADNSWVCNVVRFGYKIPLYKPVTLPKEAPKLCTIEAYDILVEEAEG